METIIKKTHQFPKGTISYTNDAGVRVTLGEFTNLTITTQEVAKCCACGTTENLHKDGWYGYRCNSVDCIPY